MKSRQNITAKGSKSWSRIRMAEKELPHKITAPIMDRTGSMFFIFIITRSHIEDKGNLINLKIDIQQC